MNRIQPTHFIEVWSTKKSYFALPFISSTKEVLPINQLFHTLIETKDSAGLQTIAIFLIKEQTTTLTERLQNRKA